MQNNTATKWVVFAFTTATNAPKTGDAAQITGSVRIDAGADNPIDDTNPTELAGGYYVFDITAAECNGDNIVIIPASSTAGVQVIGVPGAVWTRSSAIQTGDNYARLGAPAGASVSADVAAVKTDSGAIKTKTDFLPSVTAGANGGVFIAGTNAATTITTGLTTTFTGNLTGSVASVTGAAGSVTGAVGSVTGAVGSVTGNVGGNVVGSVASVTGNVGGSVATVAANGITATSIATDAINALSVKADAVTKIQTGLATPTNITAGVITTVTNVTNDPAKYMGGAVWIDTVNGAAGSASYVNGIMSNPVTTLADAKTIADNLKLKQFWIQAGSALTLAADYPGYMFNGKGYTLALGGHNISSAQIERVEGLSGIGTCATGEAVFHHCHLNTISIGEADFNYCHLNGTVTLTQASVPYLFHSCVGIGNLAKITFAAATQSCVIAKWSGALVLAGMVTGNTLFLDGDGDVTIDNTNTGGAVYISGNIKLTNSGSGQTITDTSRFDEDQSLAHVILVDTTTTNTDMVAAAPTAASNADAVWDELLSGHSGAGSAGLALSTASSGGVDPSVLADAVWDEVLSGHATAGTTGKKLTDLVNADLSGVATAANLATVDGVVDAIKATTDNLPTDPADQSAVEAAITAATSPLATSASIAALNNVSTAQVQTSAAAALTAYDPPTKAELDSVVAPLATSSSISALNNLSSAQAQTAAGAALTAYDAATGTDVAALPTAAQNAAEIIATAALTPIDANIKQVNDVTIQGTGAVGTDEWRKV